MAFLTKIFLHFLSENMQFQIRNLQLFNPIIELYLEILNSNEFFSIDSKKNTYEILCSLKFYKKILWNSKNSVVKVAHKTNL
jgi:hypothetical protein